MRVFMLDTDVSSYIIKNKFKTLAKNFNENINEHVCISSVTLAELKFGLINNYSARLERSVTDFVELVDVFDWTSAAAQRYAEIRHHLEKNGTPIGNMDMMIAASAISIDAELVTNNHRHFELVPGLKIADWMQRRCHS